MASLDTKRSAVDGARRHIGRHGQCGRACLPRCPLHVVVLYPDGRVSPTQEAQLTMFNSEDGNVRAYAVDGSFDDCHRLTKEAFANVDVRRDVRLTSANSVNIGRLLPQMVLTTSTRWRRPRVCDPARRCMSARRAGISAT